MRYKNTKNSKIKLLILILVFAVVASVVLILNRYTVNNSDDYSEDQTTSTAPTAQDSFSDGDIREPGNTLHENGGSGIITDNEGADEGNVDTSNPTVSSSGEITLYTPAPNTNITSGVTVSGTSKLTKVSYRLIDNLTGVIAMGELSVVNGKFSGKLNYSTGATEGRLDIYGTRADGREFSNIEIPLRFEQ